MNAEEIANKNTLSGEESGEPVSEQVEEKSERSGMDVVDVDPNNLEEVERKREPDVDLGQFRLKSAKIESVDTVRVNSPYAKAKDGKAHKLKVTGEIVHVLEKEGQQKIEFRASELLDLDEDEEGNNPALPVNAEGKKPSKWQCFKKALNIEKPMDAIGKTLPMKVTHNNKTDKDYLGFMYM